MMSSSKKFTPQHPLNTAVLFLVFNRFDTTKQVFEAIRQAKPPRLYVAADGPREEKENEAERVKEVRDYVMNNVDWKCDVYTLFRDKNLGCKYAVSGAITWFFDNEEQGIIFEDDCLPNLGFFWFCEELLDKYKNDDSIYLISGDARGSENVISDSDYGFCKYPLIWGWASWSRVWKHYDPEMEDWPEYSDEIIRNVSDRKATKKFWADTFSSMHEKRIDTWDYQFCYLLLKHEGKSIVPRLNQISNIGFGSEATHTFDEKSGSANRKKFEYHFPLVFKENQTFERKINKFYDKNNFSKTSFVVRVINKIAKLLLGKRIL
jgi:hypothetical protein